jgi:hypothetical protein
MDEQARKEFAEAIKKAFAKVKKPSKNNWRIDADELPAIDHKNWNDLTAKELSYSLMVFFTAEGLHYYLQAYLIAAVLDPETMEMPFMIVSRLSTSQDETDLHRLLMDFKVEEVKVIVQFFEIYRELYPIPESLINSKNYLQEENMLEQGWEYWRRRLEELQQ